MKLRNVLVASALGGAAFLLGASANATTIYSFDGENGGVPTLDYSGFANYSVSTGTVDLIGKGYFDAYPTGHLYVDLAGSSNQFGALTTDASYGPGTYTVDISLGGPIYNGITDGATISWGTGSQSYTLAGLTTADYSFNVTLTGSEHFTISDMGLSGNPNIGATLFGFQIENNTQNIGVPEPVTLSLFGAGLVGVATLRRRKKNAR